MPLQIRRGTNAERTAMTQPLAAGELIYVTDQQRLYIGNGTTNGGIQVTGYNDADAKDAAAAMITAGTHTAISFSYNTISDVLSATVDLSNYTGTINASALKGSIMADDSSLMVDTIDNKIYASNGFFGNLTGNVTGNLTGNVAGNLTGNLTGNSTGFHTGDVKGSIFADDSSVLVNGPDASINLDNTIKTNLVPATNNTYNLGSNSKIFNKIYATEIRNASEETIYNVTSKTANLAQINLESSGVINGLTMIVTVGEIALATSQLATDPWPNVVTINSSSAATNSLGLGRARGTLISQTTINNGDEIGTISFNGHDGTDLIKSAEIICTANNTVSTNTVPSKIDIKVTNSTGTLGTKVTVNATDVSFLVPPLLPVVANDSARTSLIPSASQGMMIFMQSGTTPAATNKVQVFDGSNWVNLH